MLYGTGFDLELEAENKLLMTSRSSRFETLCFHVQLFFKHVM